MLAIPSEPQALRDFAQKKIAEMRDLNARLAPKTSRISPEEVARLRQEAAASVPAQVDAAPVRPQSLTRRLWGLAVLAFSAGATK